MKIKHVTLITLLYCLLMGCSELSTTESLCVARLKGRVVSTGPVCAGVAIEIISGSFDAARVDAIWFDEYSENPVVYNNVFRTYPFCSVTNEQEEFLLDAAETGTEFYFIFETPPSGDCGFGDCPVCKPLVSLPVSTHKIRLVTEECNDVITTEG